MKLLKTIKDGDNIIDLLNNVITNIKFYINHREELNDIKVSNEKLWEYIAKMEEVKFRYENNKVPTWFREYNPTLLLSEDFPHMQSYLGFTFSLYDMVNMVLCEGMKYSFEDETYIIENTKLISNQKVIVNFTNNTMITLDKDEWDRHLKLFS